MARSIFICVVGLVSLALTTAGAVVGCGGNGNSAGQGPPDSSTTADGGSLADRTSPNQVGSEAGDGSQVFGDGGVACIEGGAGPKGTQLVNSATVSVLGLTDDDQVVYIETSSNTLLAVPAAGGTPTSIGATENSVGIASKAVFNWTGLNQDGTLSTALQLWTSARGAVALAGASLPGVADSSADGTRVLYFDNATASAADLFVAGTDGSGKTLLASGVFWTQNCMPQVVFLGSAALLGHCTAPPPPNTVTPVGTLTLYLGASGAGTTLSQSALLSIQTSGTTILFNTAEGLMAADATTGATTVVDVAGTAGELTSDGQSVVYVTTDGSIKRSPVATSSPTTLVAGGGYINVSALSPDGQWLLANKTADPNTGDVDIYIASATTPGAASAILGTATGTFYGSPFSADSSHVLYIDNAANGAGDYNAAPITGGPGVNLAAGVWIGLATTGTHVVFNENFIPNVGLQAQGIADIASIDVGTASPTPTLVVDQADPPLFFTSSRAALVYSLTFCAVGSQGIWVMPTP